ncbi:MAG: putative Ig domain-containing protein, partial [Persicimonas sp.]
MLVFLISLGMPSWAFAQKRVAVYAADDATNYNDVKAKLDASGKFDVVDTYSANSWTPTLADLNQYDAVLVYSWNTTFNNPTALGDVLADYVDAGGGVVASTYSAGNDPNYPDTAIEGRFVSADYIAASGGEDIYAGNLTMVADLASHPILAGASSFNNGSYGGHTGSVTLNPGAVQVAHLSSGEPLVVVKDTLPGRTVMLNYLPFSTDADSSYGWDATTDGDVLLANALDWAINTAPEFTSTAITAATEDQNYSYTITTTDADANDTRTIAATTAPGWLTLTDNGDGTATLAGTPTNADVGDHDVELTVTDAAGASDTQAFTVAVSNVNDAPTFTSTPVDTATQDQAYSYAVTSEDVDANDTRTIAATTAPGWLALTDNGDGTASLEGTPTNADVGDHSVELTVTDAAGDSDTQAFTVTVADVNDAPTFVDPTPADATTLTAMEAQELAFTLAGEDIDAGATLTYEVDPVPAGANFDTTTGAFSWTPQWSDAGTYTLDLSVTDGSLSDTRQITVEVSFIDADADEVPDTWETDNGLDPTTPDSDGDGIADLDEIGDDYDAPTDTDGDGTIDALDEDSDNDGVPDADEAGDDDLATPPVDTDGDGVADFRQVDSDGDGVDDGQDNCRTTENADQANLDGDEFGDACDDDIDGDGIANDVEEDIGLDPTLADSDSDGISDGDEVGDDPQNPVDTDGDGTIDALDEDSDDDGVLDADEAGDDDLATPPVDTDDDGVADFRQVDSDGDGVDDGQD